MNDETGRLLSHLKETIEHAQAVLADQTEWGTQASDTQIKYMKANKGRHKKCHCGCKGFQTHTGFANGLALTSGCEWKVRKWVNSERTPTNLNTNEQTQ